MWHRRFFLLALLIAGPALAQQNAKPTVLEGLIIDANPCANASTELMGLKIGVDQLRSVDVEKASLVIEGDDMALSLTGSLACETSTDAVGTGFVSAGIDAQVRIDLSNCVVGEISVALSDVAVEIGMLDSMSGMKELFEDQLPLLLDPALRKFVDTRAVTTCQQLKAGR